MLAFGAVLDNRVILVRVCYRPSHISGASVKVNVLPMRSAARDAVNAAKREMKIKSPSGVFQDEVGRMAMRGFGQGALMESKNQAKVIQNAARYLTGAAQSGVGGTNSYDNRKTYNQNASTTIQVDKLVVRDEQDVRSLAIEIAGLTRRQQRGKGMRFA